MLLFLSFSRTITRFGRRWRRAAALEGVESLFISVISSVSSQPFCCQRRHTHGIVDTPMELPQPFFQSILLLCQFETLFSTAFPPFPRRIDIAP